MTSGSGSGRGLLPRLRSVATGVLRDARAGQRIDALVELVRRCDYTADDLAAHRGTLRAAERLDSPVRTVNWYLPRFDYAYYGGVYTILRFASGWRARGGIRSRFVVYDAPGAAPGPMRARIAEAFPDLSGEEVVVLGARQPPPASDAAIATHWPSAYVLLRDRAAARKLYFLQDFEPRFYAAGTEYALAEATYRFGLPAIVNTPGLAEIYRRDYGGRVFTFVPAVDAALFHPPAAPRPPPFRVFLYGRPRNERNALELGLAAVSELLRRRHGAVDVVVAGDAPPRGLAGRFPGIRFLGRLPYRDTAELYRSCHAGMALMLTPHPSYPPLELMACGAVPVVNVNAANRWLFRDGENALVCEPSVTALADGLERLLADGELCRRLGEEGARTVSRWQWTDQIDAAAAFLGERA